MAGIVGPLPSAAIATLPVSLGRLYRDLLRLHRDICMRVAHARESAYGFELASVDEDGLPAEDRRFKLDVAADAAVHKFFTQPRTTDAVVVAEGLGRTIYRRRSMDPEWMVIIDPIDGTRELMFNKRPAWVLSGVAPNRSDVALQDIVLSLMTELPLNGQHKGRQAAAIAGSGEAWEVIPVGRSVVRRALHASLSPTILDGWISLVNPFPGACETIGGIADRIGKDVIGRIHGDRLNKHQIFLGQYCSTGGQMYELAAGYDRMVADLRAELIDRDLKVGLCAKPYDLSAWVISVEAGATITRVDGGPLNFPLDTTTDCSWVGYANSEIRAEVSPSLLSALSAV